MRRGDKYIVQHPFGVGMMEVIECFSMAVKVRWQNKQEEWLWLSNFKAANKYVDPIYVIVERLN
jgi:hypothetical protein